MVLYNVTINIDDDVHEDWLDWMKQKHIPDVINTGMFRGHYMFRIVSNPDSEGWTYCIQYFLNSMQDLEQYQNEYAPELQQAHNDKFEGKFVAHRTIMKEV